MDSTENIVATIIFGTAFVVSIGLIIAAMIRIARKNMKDDKKDEQ